MCKNTENILNWKCFLKENNNGLFTACVSRPFPVCQLTFANRLGKVTQRDS